MNKYYGLIVSFIAGISTVLGYISIHLRGNKDNVISKSLSFSGGVMITLSFIDLIPSSIKDLSVNNSMFYSIVHTAIYVIIGFIMSYLIERRFNRINGLYKVGVVSMFGIILHNIPEGIATYVLSTINLKLGIMLSIAIILHNIPEGICIAIPIYYSTNSKKKALIYTFVSGISEFIGALLSMIILYKYISIGVMSILFSIIAGIMIYIGYYELIATSKEYNNGNYKFYSMIGSLFIIIIEILLKI